MSPPPEKSDALPNLRRISPGEWDLVSNRLREDDATRRLRDAFESYYLDFSVREASFKAKRDYYAILRVSQPGDDLCPWFEVFDVMDENVLEGRKVAVLRSIVDLLRKALTMKIGEIGVQDLENSFESEVKERIKKLPLSRRKAFYYVKNYVKNLLQAAPLEEEFQFLV